MTAPGTPPALAWTGAVPRAARFEDVYFSAHDGLGESRAVFVEGIGAPAVWQRPGPFTVGELGFGTGLNFLTTWDRWRRTAPADGSLHFVSVEAWPLTAAQAARALAAFPALAPLVGLLLRAWPSAFPGWHHRRFADGRVTLSLGIGPVETVLDGMTGQVDAWYLDGFAPARNPAMWSEAVLQAVGQRARPGAPLATFTAAGAVRRGLQAAGFSVRKAPGFGHKRERLLARRAGEAAPPPGPTPTVVVGAGLAGLSLGATLAAEGHPVMVLDRHPAPGGEASGNPLGLVEPRLAVDDGPEGRFHALAYLDAVACYDALGLWRGRGVWRRAADARAATRHARLATRPALPPEALRLAEDGALVFPTGGCLTPPEVLAAWRRTLERHGGRFQGNRAVAGLMPTPAGWRLVAADGRGVAEAPRVVLAAAMGTETLVPGALPLAARRGQIAILPEAVGTAPDHALSYGGYLSPAVALADGTPGRVCGATFDPWPPPEDRAWATLRAEDQARILAQLAEAHPDLAARWPAPLLRGRAALRATTPDRMPVAGPLCDGLTPRPGLYALTGLGSRGLQTAPLLAAVLAARMAGRVPPVDAPVRGALAPDRFYRRALRRRGG